MATRASPTNTGYFLAGFNLVVILLLFALFLKQRENQAPEPVQLASGAWSPYSGEQLPEQGIATAMVVEALKHMGQPVQLHFMPWEQAEDLARAGESVRDIRATFPYARVGVREDDFYFSLPILNVEQALFVHPEAFDLDRAGELMVRWENEAGLDWDAIAQPDLFDAEDREALQRQRRNVQRELEVQRQTRRSAGLDQEAMEKVYRDKFVRLVALRMTLKSLNARILPISGYEYPDAFDGLFVTGESPMEDGLAAFARLRQDQDKTRPLVVIEALRVARQLLLDHYPLDYLAMFGAGASSSQPQGFGRLPVGFESGVHLMAGKRNADNLNYYCVDIGLEFLAPLGATENYLLVMKKALAVEHGIKTLSDLSLVADQLVFTADPEFLNRRDCWLGLQQLYGLKFRDVHPCKITDRYALLEGDQAQVFVGYETDPELRKHKLLPLVDDEEFFPRYAAVPLVNRGALEAVPGMRQALMQLEGKISTDDLVEAVHKLAVSHCQRTEVDKLVEKQLRKMG